MAGGRAQSSMPTQAERLKDPQVLNSTVRSYSLNEYDQKRPDYINPDRNAGQAWANLGRSLDKFYGAFKQYSETERDRYIERGIALGTTNMEHAVESEGAQANRKNWKEFVENHPEFANNNPWVEVGYNQARLRNLGMEMDTGLQTALENSGLYNKDDPEAVQAFINQYIQEFRTGAGIDNMDAIQVAKHFSSTEAKVRASATASYEKYRFSQRQTNLANEVHDGIVSALANNKMSPDEQNAYIKELVETAAANGLLNDRAESVVPEAIKAAYAMSNNEKLLDRCKSIEVNGRKLIAFKGVPEWISAEKTRIASRQAAEAQKAMLAHERFLNKESDKLGNEAALLFTQGKLSIDKLDDWLKEKGITDPSLMFRFKGKFNSAINIDRSNKQIAITTPEFIAKATDEVNWMKANLSLDGQAQLAKSRFEETNSPIFLSLWNNATQSGLGEEKSIDTAKQSVNTQAETKIMALAGKLVEDEVSRIKQTEQGKTAKFNSTGAASDITKVAHRAFLTKVGAAMAEFEGEGGRITPTEYKKIAGEAFKEVAENLNMYVGDSLSERRLIIPKNPVGEDDDIRDFGRNIPADKRNAASLFRNDVDSFLESTSNADPHVKHYTSLNKLNNIVDTEKMFMDGHSGPITVRELVAYARPNSPYKGLKVTSDGGLVSPYKLGSSRSVLENMILMDNPDAKISYDTAPLIQAHMSNQTNLSRSERVNIYNAAVKHGINTSELASGLNMGITISSKWTAGGEGFSFGEMKTGDVIFILRNKGASDKDILDILNDAAQASKPSNRRSRPTSKDD